MLIDVYAHADSEFWGFYTPQNLKQTRKKLKMRECLSWGMILPHFVAFVHAFVVAGGRSSVL